jgi:EAL domain-containing protein (putative c-di-GMP-specific phosphodiesterase class I)
LTEVEDQMLNALHRIAATASLAEHEIDRILAYVRHHLAMEVAWISRATDAGQLIEAIDGEGKLLGLQLGSALPWSAEGEPSSGGPWSAGAVALAPLRHSDGRLYGYLGCMSQEPRPWLRVRDDEFLQLAAALLAPNLDAHEIERHRRGTIGARIQTVLDAGGPDIVYQPIRSLSEQRTVAFEAFSRFPMGEGPCTPDGWFAEAAEVGLDTALEVAAVRSALSALHWTEPHHRIAINSSAANLRHPRMLTELNRHDMRRVIIEITEHDLVQDYNQLRAVTRVLQDLGASIAVDDAGTGHAGFTHLIEIRPDIIKLDHQLVHAIDADSVRAAMATALLRFAKDIGATVVAEGIETAGELQTVTRLEIDYAQGYHIARPTALPQTLEALGRPDPIVRVSLPEQARDRAR